MTGVLRLLGWASLIFGFISGLIHALMEGNLFSFLGIISFIFSIVGGGIGAIIFFTLAYILEYLESMHAMLSELRKSDQNHIKTSYPEKGKSPAASIFSEAQDNTSLSETIHYKMKSID